MIHRPIVRILLVLVCLVGAGLVFFSTSFSNPLIGTWKVTKIEASDVINQISIDRYKMLQPKQITFSEKEMGVVAHEGKENKVPVTYKEEKDGVWSFSIDGGKTWNEMRFQDKNTVIRREKKALDVVITYTLNRMQ